MKYDPSVEKHVIKGFLNSPWEREDWNPTTWTDIRNGKKVFLLGEEK
jgi:hypothetical protein